VTPRTFRPAAVLAAALLASCRGDADPSAARMLPGPEIAPGSEVGPGEEVYRAEHCDRCHTERDAPPGSGPATLPVPALPELLDSRVGPDLGLEGHRRSDDWQYAHLYAPEVLVPGSRMPSSRHLFEPGPSLPPRPKPEAVRLVAYLQALGRARRDVWAEFRSRDPEIPQPQVEDRRALDERGARLYGTHCVMCHGEAGDGRGPAAALLRFAPRDLGRAEFHFRSVPLDVGSSDVDLFRVLTLGTGAGAAMPSFAHLPPGDRWALVHRVRGFKAPVAAPAASVPAPAGTPVPESAPSPQWGPAGEDTRPAGEQIWTAWGCGVCHGARGEGGPPTPGTDLRHACMRRAGGSVLAFERALRFGVGTTMPSFAAELDGRPEAARALLAWLEGDGGGASTTPEPPPASRN
jgi:mono/diheme cytochrome c family protein